MPNALIDETSPYLLQHAHNPVEWLPWGERAFALAKSLGKPVFLSIGYSTCHWCHVMERESFEVARVAEAMNRNFVNVKVDREERPDVDATYMAFVQATTGQGGWPMSVWLTPDGKPLVGGTYFPPEDRHGRAGFVTLCEEIGRLWREDRGRLETSAENVMAHLRSQAEQGAVMHGLPGPKVFGDFLDRCEALFDATLGGWGGAPKFPRPVVPRLLLQLADRFGAASDEGGTCLQMVERTLHAMAAGGMNDQLGGGFHRYSVDRYWHVPHYEKMLYDQGQLASLYLEAWQATGEHAFRETAEEIFRYVLDDLTDAGGAFHAAEDADSLRRRRRRKSVRVRSGRGRRRSFPNGCRRGMRPCSPRPTACRRRATRGRKAIRMASWRGRTHCSARRGTNRSRSCSNCRPARSGHRWRGPGRSCSRRAATGRCRIATTRS